MKKVKKILLLLFIALLALGVWFFWRIAGVGNGYAAKYLCSLTFNSGLDPDAGFENYIRPMHPLFRLVRHQVDTERKEVRTSFVLGFRPRRAVWREGCGCTLLVEDTPASLHARHHTPHRLSPQDTSLLKPGALWPEGQVVNRDSLHLSVDWAAIDRILDAAMVETTDDPGQKHNTLALAVTWKGRIIGERYAEGVDANTPLLGWSMAKSITGSLAGVMVQKHNLDIHAPAGFTQWQNDGRRGITIDHLLRMESGLEFEENYAPMADATEMLYESTDMGAFGLTFPAEADPGTRWSYSSGTSNILSDVLYHHVGSSPEAIHRLAYDAFFNKLGITTAIMEHDESDAFVGSSYCYMSARDWLRVGQLYMNKGVWNGEQLLPKGWVQYAVHPTPNATDACYGAHIWLNAAAEPEARRMPELPRDAFMFSGFQGQWVVCIPSWDMMLVRLGVSNGETWWPQQVLVPIADVVLKSDGL